MKTKYFLLSCLVASPLLLLSNANAHATFEKKSVPADSYQRLALGIPHGCGDKATTAVTVEIPEGVISVKPQPKAGWKLATELDKYKTPMKNHGKTITEGVKKVTWSNGNLPTNFFDEFKLSVKMPNKADTTIYFKVDQQCGSDAIRWIEIPEAGKNSHDYKRPAPGIKLTEGKHHHH